MIIIFNSFFLFFFIRCLYVWVFKSDRILIMYFYPVKLGPIVSPFCPAHNDKAFSGHGNGSRVDFAILILISPPNGCLWDRIYFNRSFGKGIILTAPSLEPRWSIFDISLKTELSIYFILFRIGHIMPGKSRIFHVDRKEFAVNECTPFVLQRKTHEKRTIENVSPDERYSAKRQISAGRSPRVAFSPASYSPVAWVEKHRYVGPSSDREKPITIFRTAFGCWPHAWITSTQAYVLNCVSTDQRRILVVRFKRTLEKSAHSYGQTWCASGPPIISVGWLAHTTLDLNLATTGTTEYVNWKLSGE